MKSITCVTVAALMLAGCATRASSVAPVSVSAADYSSLSCQQSRDELQTARTRENALARRQNNAAVADAASVFLFLLPLGSVFGADVSGELAEAKGETNALERRVRDACSVSSATRPAVVTAALPQAPAAPVAQGLMPVSTPQAAAAARTEQKNCGFVVPDC